MDKLQLPISVVITTFNEASNIEKWCDSLLAQTAVPSELIVVDSESNDSTLSKIDQKMKGSNIVTKLITKKCNISEGRNIAIDAASNEKIAVTDGGVELVPEWLYRIYNGLEHSEVVAGYYSFGGNNKYQKAYKSLFYVGTESVDSKAFLPSSRSLGLLKKCWKSVGGYNEDFRIGEDTDFDLKLKKAGFKFFFEPLALVEWELRPTLAAMFKQQYLYSKWDGIIRQNVFGNSCFSIWLLTLLVLLTLSFTSLWWMGAFAFSLTLPILIKTIKQKTYCESSLVSRFQVLTACYIAKGIGFLSGVLQKRA